MERRSFRHGRNDSVPGNDGFLGGVDSPGISGLERGQTGNPAAAVVAGFHPDDLIEEGAFLFGGRGSAPNDADGQEVAGFDLAREVHLAATVADIGSGGMIAVGYAVEADAGDFDVKRESYALAASTLFAWSNAHMCAFA